MFLNKEGTSEAAGRKRVADRQTGVVVLLVFPKRGMKGCCPFVHLNADGSIDLEQVAVDIAAL
jgi:hypothetical protein